MAPSENVVIRNNVFIADAIGNRKRIGGGIVANLAHDTMNHNIPEQGCAHKNITITGNRFVNMKDTAIFMNAVDGVNVYDNEFINCCYANDDRPVDLQYVNIFKNCKNVNYGDNKVIDCAVKEKNI